MKKNNVHESWHGIILLGLFMEVYGKTGGDEIGYDDLIGFLIHNPATGRHSSLKVDEGCCLLFEQEEAFVNKMFKSADFRKDILNFLGYLFTRYGANPDERIVDIRSQFDHWSGNAAVIDREDTWMIQHFLWGDEERHHHLSAEYESFFRVYHTLNENSGGPDWTERVLDALNSATGTFVFEALPRVCPDKLERLMEANSLSWVCRNTLLGRFLAFTPVPDSFVARISTYFGMTMDDDVKKHITQILRGPNRSVIIQVWRELFDGGYADGEYLTPMGTLAIAYCRLRGKSPIEEAKQLIGSNNNHKVALGMACLIYLLDSGERPSDLEGVIEKVLSVLKDKENTCHCAAAAAACCLVCNGLLPTSLLDDDAIFLNAVKRMIDCPAEAELVSLLPHRSRAALLRKEQQSDLVNHFAKIFCRIREDPCVGYGEIYFGILTNLGGWDCEAEMIRSFDTLLCAMRERKKDVSFREMARFQLVADSFFGVYTGTRKCLSLETIDLDVVDEWRKASRDLNPSPVSAGEAFEIITCLRFDRDEFTDDEARNLLRRPLSDEVMDPYVVCMWLYFMVMFGLTEEALAFCEKHLRTLLRPNWLPMGDSSEDSDALGAERAWTLVGRSMNRLTFAMRIAQIRRQNQLIKQFLRHPRFGQYIDLNSNYAGPEEDLLLLQLLTGNWHSLKTSFFYDSQYDISYRLL